MLKNITTKSTCQNMHHDMISACFHEAKKSIKLILSDEDYSRINIEYNIVDKIDSTSKVGDNLGFVDILLDGEIIASESIYLKDTIYEGNLEDDSYKQKLIIPTIAMLVSFFIVAAISIRLFFKSKSKPKKKKTKKQK